MSRNMNRLGSGLVLMLLSLGIWTPALVRAEEAGAAAPTEISALQEQVASITQAVTDRKVALDTLWVLVTAFLVFWMNAGFALVESGFCRAKNAVNILSKNFIVFAISSLAFYVLGWGLMFGDGNGFMGLKGLLFFAGADNSPAPGCERRGDASIAPAPNPEGSRQAVPLAHDAAMARPPAPCGVGSFAPPGARPGSGDPPAPRRG